MELQNECNTGHFFNNKINSKIAIAKSLNQNIVLNQPDLHSISTKSALITSTVRNHFDVSIRLFESLLGVIPSLLMPDEALRAKHPDALFELIRSSLALKEERDKKIRSIITVLEESITTCRPTYSGIVSESQSSPEKAPTQEIDAQDRPWNPVAANAALITHNLRGYFRTCIFLAKEFLEAPPPLSIAEKELHTKTEEELFGLTRALLTFKEERDQKIVFILAVLADGLTTCDDVYEQIMSQKDEVIAEKSGLPSEKLVSIHQELSKLTPLLLHLNTSRNLHSAEVVYSSSIDASLTHQQFAALKSMIINLVNNAKRADASQIMIDLRSASVPDNINSPHHLIVEVKDNGKGIEDDKFIANFFKRPLPQKAPNFFAEVEADRGEGTLMSYLLFKRYGGEATCARNNDGGMTFSLFFTEALNRPQDKAVLDSSMIGPMQQETLRLQLSDLVTHSPKGIIVLADDQRIPLILLARKLYPLLSEKSSITIPINSRSKWDTNSIIFDRLNGWGIVFVANATSVCAVIDMCPINLLITDNDMPGGMSGLELIKTIRDGEKTRSGPKIKIALNTAEEANLTASLSTEYDFTPVLKGDLKSLTSILFKTPEHLTDGDCSAEDHLAQTFNGTLG